MQTATKPEPAKSIGDRGGLMDLQSSGLLRRRVCLLGCQRNGQRMP